MSIKQDTRVKHNFKNFSIVDKIFHRDPRNLEHKIVKTIDIRQVTDHVISQALFKFYLISPHPFSD
jgi:hypothetical protein